MFASFSACRTGHLDQINLSIKTHVKFKIKYIDLQIFLFKYYKVLS